MSSPDYKRLYEEAKQETEKVKQEAEKAKQEAEKAKQEAEYGLQEERRKRQEAEQKTNPTTLPQLLDACHVNLQSGLEVQAVALSTKGNPSNARQKRRPDYIREWTDFPSRQVNIWNELASSPFMIEGHFASRHTILEIGKYIRRRKVGSELDIHHFQRSTVDDQVSLIIECIYKDEELRDKFSLKGSVQFENHANTLSPDDAFSEGIRSIDISKSGRRRSPRLLEMEQRNQPEFSRPVSTGSDPASQAQTSRPRADQFCVYNISTNPGSEERVPAFIVEYKAPHKLTLEAIQKGLRDMALQDVLDYGDDDTPQKKFQRLVAAAMTQTFSYMVAAGLEFGYVCTAQAYIFLQIPENPDTLRYFLSVPQADVGESTGWSDSAASSTMNRLHLTAVAQVLAFTLQAVQSPPRSHEWRAKAENTLSTWEFLYSEVLDAAPSPEATPSEYWPSPGNDLMRVSPISLRQRPVPRKQLTCRPTLDEVSEGGDPDSDHGNPDTPCQASRKPTAGAAMSQSGSGQISKGAQSNRGERGDQRTRAFCTKRCLLGLVNGGDLDRDCANVNEHGTDVHRINKSIFLSLMRDQLSRTLDSDFEPCGRPGSRGVPFRATLTSYGYTVIAKCTTADFVAYLRHEAAVYDRLRTIQGHCIPAHLGNLDLQWPYYYEGIAKLVHVMFLGYGGTPISRHWRSLDQQSVLRQVEKCMSAIHGLGVLHRDLMPQNILWDCDSSEVMVIDFERAKMVQVRGVLGQSSINRKRKPESGSNGPKRIGYIRELFEQEMAGMRQEMSWL